MKKKKKKTESQEKKKSHFQSQAEEREYFISLVKNRFQVMEKNKRGQVFCLSIQSLLEEVFSLEEMSLDMAKKIYLLLRGDEPLKISKKFDMNHNSLRSNLRRFYTKELDAESGNDVICKILLWLLQKKNILLIPSEEKIKQGLTLKEVEKIII